MDNIGFHSPAGAKSKSLFGCKNIVFIQWMGLNRGILFKCTILSFIQQGELNPGDLFECTILRFINQGQLNPGVLFCCQNIFLALALSAQYWASLTRVAKSRVLFEYLSAISVSFARCDRFQSF